jgi:hypothetical protein
MAIGVFGLQVAYRLKRLEVMSTDDTHGWFGGGYTPAVTSSVERIDFSNDTATALPRGPLSLARGFLAAVSNSNYGWFGGGNPSPSAVSTVDRIDFSNDSSTASVRGTLASSAGNPSNGKGRLSATGNSNYGWFIGGFNFVTILSTIDRIDFSNDSSTAPVRGYVSNPEGLYQSAATGNSNYGWYGGGQIGGNVPISTIYRIDFSNDAATSSTRGPLTLEKINHTATGNSNYGWFGGGQNPTPALVTTVERIDFSNDASTASVRGPLTSARQSIAATGNSNYGWFSGGIIISPIQYFTAVDRIDFSNDSVSASSRGQLTSPPAGSPPAGRAYSAATSGQAKGPAIKLQKAGNYGSYGWFGGGAPAPGGFSATIDRINFINDSVTALARAALVGTGQARTNATGNSNYGWWIGGRNGAPIAVISTISRIDFSNDSVTASAARGPLIGARYSGEATGNSNYGWYCGTQSGVVFTANVERIDFSNDLSATMFRGAFSTTKDSADAVSTHNYGWFGGGATITTVDRLNFSNDLSTPLTKGSLITGRYGLAGTANSNYGWFAGGTPGSNASFNVVERINFSNDSATALTRGVLSQARFRLTAAGNSNYGWFGGGFVNILNARATVDRIDFANDSVSASPRSPLSAVKYGLGGVSNTTVS